MLSKGDDMEKGCEQLYDVSKLSRGLLIKGLLPYYVLRLLSQDKMYGKKILDRIKGMSRGSWKPSPGSIYPLLRRMVRLGLVSEYLDDANGHLKRIYELTDAGRAALAEMREDIHPRLKRTIELLTAHLQELEKLEDYTASVSDWRAF
jgi:DNA-binding PadR family transcriptional regulator